MRHRKRHAIWLTGFFLLSLVVGASLFIPPQRITRENFDRIREGMTLEEATAILGYSEPMSDEQGGLGHIRIWSSGPSSILVLFTEGRVERKAGHFSDTWATIRWYAKQGAAKIGVKWD